MNLPAQPADVREWTAAAYEVLLLTVGAYLLARQFHRERGQPARRIAPWNAGWLDFAAWLFLICFAISLASQFFAPTPAPGPDQEMSDVRTLQLGCVRQVLVLLAQIGIYFLRVDVSPPPLNREPLKLPQIFAQGLQAFVTNYPIIFLTGLVWVGALQLTRQVAPEIKTPPQTAVELISHQTDPGVLLLITIFAVTLAPVNEELLFRAGIYRFLKGKFPTTVALAVTSVLFALAHVNLLQFLPLAAIGWLLARTYERSGHIGVCMVFHALFNLSNIGILLLTRGQL
ncbi:MAG TPA: CPBP family intramembrane glutamic endopeptidase [Opitutales bacterium]|nr:CPBP family intramembrane glutamic endopeptidase [Opitutales bacterium]